MEKLTDKEIKVFLENFPLYQWKEYSKPTQNRENLWINEIDEYCEVCKQFRPFQDLRSRGSGHPMAAIKPLKTGTSYFKFTCASCKKDNHIFLLEQEVTGETIKIQKYGQLPRKKLERDSKLQKFFMADAEYYEKAVISLSNGYGIAAFSYFRRIVELNINDLLDLVIFDLDGTDDQSEITKSIEELKKETSMSDKIKIANNALPEYLKPDGLNPLGRIYAVLSEGIHSLSDDECLKKAEIVRACLSFLVSELASRKRNRSHFKKMAGSM